MREALAIFDMDGTLVDSGGVVADVMRAAFEKNEAIAPESVCRLIGLSLPRMVAELAGDLPAALQIEIVADYRLGFAAAMENGGEPDLYPGVTEGLDRLTDAGIKLGIATGKSKRGVDRLIAAKGWGGRFATLQCADFHPSKPHPSMIRRALLDTTTQERNAAMIGDSTYDMEMATAAGIAALGVSWGYHTERALRDAGAEIVFDRFDALVDGLLKRFA